jgi:hypothetical protein
MPLRPLAVSILIFIFLISGIFHIYIKLHHQHPIYIIPSNLHWIGVIDLDYDHGIDMEGIIQGHDALLVIDNNNPIFQQLILKLIREKPALTFSPFEIGDYVANSDGLLNEENPVYPFLHVVVFSPENRSHEVKTLAQAGIRGIKTKHLENNRNHEVIMSDGTTRTLYEINKAGGTSVYTTRSGKQATSLP